MAQAILIAEMQDIAPTNIINIQGEAQAHKKNRIQVSNTKKPLFFYLNLAKRYIKQYDDVELSALGMAIPTLVTIAEILKANGVAIEKKVVTSTVGSKDESKGRLVQKAKLEIVLERNEKYPTTADVTDNKSEIREAVAESTEENETKNEGATAEKGV